MHLNPIQTILTTPDQLNNYASGNNLLPQTAIFRTLIFRILLFLDWKRIIWVTDGASQKKNEGREWLNAAHPEL